eukprot:915534_1
MSFLLVTTGLILSMLSIGGKSGLLDQLPVDLRNHLFSSFLNLKDRVRCIAPLNRECYNYYTHTHGRQVQDMKQLEEWLQPPQTTSHLNQIQDMMLSLKFSEILSIHLPTLLTQLNTAWSDGVLSDGDLVQTLHAMELRPLGIDEFKHNLTSLSFPLRLLLLSSRALINYYIPNYFANSDKQNETIVGLCRSDDGAAGIDSFTYWENFPWLRPINEDPPDPAFSDCLFETELWVHYLTYLYEFCFSQITRGSLNSLFQLDGSAREMVKGLIENYGLIPWDKASVMDARSSFDSCNLFEIYVDFLRVERALNLPSVWFTNYAVSFRRYLVLNLYAKDGCFFGVDVVQRQELKATILHLCYASWWYKRMMYRGWYKKLSFRNNFLNTLWCSGKPIFFDADGNIQRLVTEAIINSNQSTS